MPVSTSYSYLNRHSLIRKTTTPNPTSAGMLGNIEHIAQHHGDVAGLQIVGLLAGMDKAQRWPVLRKDLSPSSVVCYRLGGPQSIFLGTAHPVPESVGQFVLIAPVL